MKLLKKSVRYFLYSFFTILACTGIYFLAAVVCMIIPVGDKTNPTEATYKVWVYSNGAHTDFILPKNNNLYNWSDFIDFSDFDQQAQSFDYLAFGFGEHDFYMNTPTWNDLTVSTAIQALFIPSQSAMHVDLRRDIPGRGKLISIALSKSQYIELTRYIKSSFSEFNPHDHPQPIQGGGYWKSDQFYPAHKSYHLFYTCNEWINCGLKEINVRTALWSPFDIGIFYYHSPVNQ